MTSKFEMVEMLVKRCDKLADGIERLETQTQGLSRNYRHLRDTKTLDARRVLVNEGHTRPTRGLIQAWVRVETDAAYNALQEAETSIAQQERRLSIAKAALSAIERG